ncbi:MAG: SDR family oxidoreductase [Deltaproteobacteria bacterium]|nr:SDR family oxidoreductase [Deltaproteobacteria bacterium]
MTSSTVLLTGGSGVVGWELTTRFARAGFGVYLLVRKGSRKALRERVSAFRLTDAAAADRVRLFTGDLLAPHITDDESRSRIVAECDGVVHAACERRSDKPRDQVFDTNLGGTRALLELAGTLEKPLRRFMHVSDFSVVGDHRGVFFEDDLFVGQGFGADVAAESRLLAERHVRRAMRSVPATVVRLAHPVVNKRDPARVADPLAGLGRGSRRARWAQWLVHADPPLVHALPLDLMGRAVLAAFEEPDMAGGTLHVADPAAPTVTELLTALGRSGSAYSLGLPAEGARLDTTGADALLRHAGIGRPSLADLAAALS